MLNVVLLSKKFHIFVDGNLLIAIPLKTPEASLNMSSVVFTYLSFVEPQLIELGLIRRKSLDCSEYFN